MLIVVFSSCTYFFRHSVGLLAPLCSSWIVASCLVCVTELCDVWHVNMHPFRIGGDCEASRDCTCILHTVFIHIFLSMFNCTYASVEQNVHTVAFWLKYRI